MGRAVPRKQDTWASTRFIRFRECSESSRFESRSHGRISWVADCRSRQPCRSAEADGEIRSEPDCRLFFCAVEIWRCRKTSFHARVDSPPAGCFCGIIDNCCRKPWQAALDLLASGRASLSETAWHCQRRDMVWCDGRICVGFFPGVLLDGDVPIAATGSCWRGGVGGAGPLLRAAILVCRHRNFAVADRMALRGKVVVPLARVPAWGSAADRAAGRVNPPTETRPFAPAGVREAVPRHHPGESGGFV